MNRTINIPNHIAVIPDGNRRWAKERGLPESMGHWEGAKNTQNILKIALDLKIPCFTFWGCSVGNLTKRKKTEVSVLYKIFEMYFKKLIKAKEVHDNKIKISILGSWRDYFPTKTKEVAEKLIAITENYTGQQLNFLMAYSGTEEMVRAVRNITKNNNKEVNEKTIKQNLYTKDLPPVDLIIRTGGEPHLSAGFMMWDASDAQLFFSDLMYPAFTPAEFQKAIDIYNQRERRLGK